MKADIDRMIAMTCVFFAMAAVAGLLGSTIDFWFGY
jgi:hypothetical protein